MKKKRALVICPGRGTYTKESLGYLQGWKDKEGFLQDLDEKRRQLDLPTITALDGAQVFKADLHARGEHASPLIYACAFTDFLQIDQERFEIVAITGNSMGWYLALAMGRALDKEGAFQVIQTMGSMMKDEMIGGQVIYPLVNDQWQESLQTKLAVEKLVQDVNQRQGHFLYKSILLGGYLVLGGNAPALKALLKELPAIENYPFRLIHHAAFHTPLLEETSQKAFHLINENLFQAPQYPLIDGQGRIWAPCATSPRLLYQYTLGAQVTQVYDFTKAIEVGLKEFMPDVLILLGPGSSLGGPLGQILITLNWHHLKSKDDFIRRQSQDPFLLAMGRADQKKLVVA